MSSTDLLYFKDDMGSGSAYGLDIMSLSSATSLSSPTPYLRGNLGSSRQSNKLKNKRGAHIDTTASYIILYASHKDNKIEAVPINQNIGIKPLLQTVADRQKKVKVRLFNKKSVNYIYYLFKKNHR